MFRCALIQAKLINASFFFLFLLIFCKYSLANPFANYQQVVQFFASEFVLDGEKLSSENFDAFVKKVELMQDSSPNKAFVYLASFEASLSSLPLENQLVFYKLQSELYHEIGQFSLSKAAASRGLKLAKQLSSPSIAITELLYARGFAIESLGDLNGALAEYVNGLQVAESLNNKKYVAMGLINLGAIYYLTEKFEQALTVFNDALVISTDVNDDELKGYVSSELGILYSHLGQTEKSMSFYQKSYEHYQKAGKVFYAYNSLRNIAFNHSANERYDEAITLYKEIIDNGEDIGDVAILATVYSGMAWAQLNKKDKDEEASYQYMLIASQYFAQSEQYDVPVTHALDRGFLMLKMKRYQEALDSADEASRNMNKYAEFKGNYAATISNISVLYLQAESNYQLKNYQQAYQYQQQLTEFAAKVRERANMDEIDDLRMRYESDQADLTRDILAQEKSLQQLLLVQGNQTLENRKFWLVVIAIISLLLAWVLIKVVIGQKQLIKATSIDDLTGVENRRRIMEVGKKHFRKVKRSADEFSLLMLDIDDFKGINDQHGHQVGDEVLRNVSLIGKKMVKQNSKHKSTLFGRLGGEEFIVLLPDFGNSAALDFAEQLRESISQFNWQLIRPNRRATDTESVSTTVSIGVASFTSSQYKDFDAMVQAADFALYQAKDCGKNKVCTS